MFPWFLANYIEVLGVIFSVLYLWFSIRQKILLWPTGMISAFIYMVVFFQSKFYADMGLNAYYFLISIYGWIVWSKGHGSSGHQRPVSRIQWKTGMVLLVLTVPAFLGIGIILEKYTDSPVPYWDALTTALSFAATWMLARKILEHWLLWIMVDAISLVLYLYRGLYPTMILFAIYTILAIVGYIEWKKVQPMARP